GVVSVRDNQALAPGSSTTVASGATLDVQGTLSVNEPITLNGAGVNDSTGNPTGALRATNGTATDTTLTGIVTLASNTSIGGDNGSTLTITGTFTGSPDLTKLGLGTLIFPNANPTFTGNTAINDGTVIIRTGQSLGPAVGGGTILVNNPGTLQAEGIFTINKTLTLNGLGFSSGGALKLVGGANTDVIWAGPITLGSATSINTDPSSRLTVSGLISGGATATLEKGGTGTLVLARANSYLGATTLRDGVTIIQDNQALGGANGGGTNVSSGATLQLGGGLNIGGEALTLRGTGVANIGALHVTDGTNTWGGLVNLSGTSNASGATDGTSQPTFSNIISGAAPLEKIGTGTLTLSGTQANTSTGATLIDAGTLLLNKSANTQALGGDVTIGDGNGGQNADILRLLAGNQIADSANVAV